MSWLKKIFQSNKSSKTSVSDAQEVSVETEEQRMKRLEERARRREEYESKYMNVRPAKLMSGNYSRADVLQIKENPDGISYEQMGDSDDSEAKLKREMKTMNEYAESIAGEAYHRRHKPVNKEEELKKARELQRKLEFEEEEKYMRYLRDRKN